MIDRIAAGVLAASLLQACLPDDPRPAPGSALVTVAPSETITRGMSTADGWDITFERFLVGLGEISLKGSECTSYADARYERLFDLTVPGRQKVGQVFGLGACSLWFQMRSPSRDALLGQGVSEGDMAFMRTLGEDAYVVRQRVSAYVQGRASRGGTTKRFAWTFRAWYLLYRCDVGAGADTKPAKLIDIQGGQALDVELLIDGGSLFRASVDEGAALRFDALAEADVDADQIVTLEELSRVEASPSNADAGLRPGAQNLADLVYRTLVPHTIGLGSGAVCNLGDRPSRP